jgi:hypothetical protein
MTVRRRLALGAGTAALALVVATAAHGWDVRCVDPSDATGEAKCPDPFANAQTFWRPHPQAEHRRLLELSLGLAGIPEALQDPFDLVVYTGSETLEAAGGSYTTIRPVRIDAEREQERRLAVPMMANLPDFSYTLWDWASGNELCPPDPGNPSGLDCHNYESHIGWLNSNHMLPQARHWYGYLHSVAVERAQACAGVASRFEGAQRTRFEPWLVACEKEALAIEGVAQHYLQDAWAAGHMLERWGSVEIRDFGGDRALGMAIGAFVGAIHGSKALLDDDPHLGSLGPFDDPINAPHADVGYVDPLDGPSAIPRPGVGDRFLRTLLGEVAGLGDYGAQREALFGCAVDGLREVYAATAQLHGALEAVGAGVDSRRSVDADSCWAQRVTNLGFDTGLGVHRGAFDEPAELLFDGPSAWALANVLGKFLLDAPQMTENVKLEFQRDVAYNVTEARMKRLAAPNGIELASGRLWSLAGIGPNREYARGGPGVPPASYSDPLLPWSLSESDLVLAERKEALHLTFADAHAADRCDDFTDADLAAYRAAVADAPTEDPEVEPARCGQCARMLAPHLRFGTEQAHDPLREAFCAFAAEPPVAPAFVYTGEDASQFTGVEPRDLEALLEAAATVCGCDPLEIEATLPEEVEADVDVPLGVRVVEAFGEREPVAGALVALSASGGTTAVSEGTTGPDGRLDTTARADGSEAELVVELEARAEPGGPVLAAAVVSAAVAQPVGNCAPSAFVDRTDPGADRTVTVGNFVLSPRCLKMLDGQGVTYQRAAGQATHSLLLERIGGGADLTVSLGGPVTRFPEAGDYDVRCTLHPAETGGLRVLP